MLRVKVSGAASNAWMWIVTRSLFAFSNISSVTGLSRQLWVCLCFCFTLVVVALWDLNVGYHAIVIVEALTSKTTTNINPTNHECRGSTPPPVLKWRHKMAAIHRPYIYTESAKVIGQMVTFSYADT